jgi:DNA-binding response OmpR family regulator
MAKEKRGNIVLHVSDEKLQFSLKRYFSRKFYKVMLSSTVPEISVIIRDHAVKFVIFEGEKDLQTNIEIANNLLSIDSYLIIYFICDNAESTALVEQANNNFITLQKPFTLRKLINKMNISAYNIGLSRQQSTNIQIGKYRFNPTTNLLTLDEGDTHTLQHLNKKEAALLLMLFTNQGKVVTTHRIISDIWKKDDHPTTRSMNVYVTHLRRYLSLDENIVIENKHAVGFSLTIKD